MATGILTIGIINTYWRWEYSIVCNWYGLHDNIGRYIIMVNSARVDSINLVYFIKNAVEKGIKRASCFGKYRTIFRIGFCDGCYPIMNRCYLICRNRHRFPITRHYLIL